MQRNGRKDCYNDEKREIEETVKRKQWKKVKQQCKAEGTTQQTDSILQIETLRIGSASNKTLYNGEFDPGSG